MNIEFDMRLSAKDLYKFNMRQAYLSFNGVISILIPILCFVMAGAAFSQKVYSSVFIYGLFGIILLVYMPGSLWLHVKKIMKSGNPLAEGIHYIISEKGINVKVKDEEALMTWDLVYKVVETADMLLIFSSRRNAYILKKEQLDGSYEAIKEQIMTVLPKYRYKFKK